MWVIFFTQRQMRSFVRYRHGLKVIKLLVNEYAKKREDIVYLSAIYHASSASVNVEILMDL